MSDAARKAAEKKVLPREKFLRYLHVVADAEASEDAPTFEEITLAEHDAALRALLASPPATPAHDPKPNCPDCYGLGLYLYGGTEAPRVCGCRPTEPAPALPEEIREAAERLRDKMRTTYADTRYMNVWATAQERLGPYTGPNWIAEAEALDAALASRGGRS